MASMLPAAAGAAALVNQARATPPPGMRYQNGNLVRATGNQQGPANGQGGLQTPGIVPPMPTGTPPNPGGPQPPPVSLTGPNPTANPWGGGPQSLGAQGIQQAIDTYTPGGMQAPGDQLQTMIAHEQPQRPPGSFETGGVNQAGGGASTFNLPGFKPASQVGAAVEGAMAGQQKPQDPNAMRQALGAMPDVMNRIDQTPNAATSPLGVSPGSPAPGPVAGVLAGRLPPGFGQVPPQGGGGPDQAGVSSALRSFAAKQPGGASGGGGTPWAPPGVADANRSTQRGFQLRGFKPKPRQSPGGLDSMTGGDVPQPAPARQGRQNMKPGMGQF